MRESEEKIINNKITTLDKYEIYKIKDYKNYSDVVNLWWHGIFINIPSNFILRNPISTIISYIHIKYGDKVGYNKEEIEKLKKDFSFKNTDPIKVIDEFKNKKKRIREKLKDKGLL